MIVGGRDTRRAHVVAALNQTQNIIDGLNDFLLQSDDLHLLLAILQHTQLLLVVEQVEYLLPPHVR
jgi:hypothetical protein